METNTPNTTPETTAKPKKVFLNGDQKKKVVKMLIALVVILVVTNPYLIPFLPEQLKDAWAGAIGSLFGDLTSASQVIQFNWVSLFKLLVMVLALGIARELILAGIKAMQPKTGRGQTLKTIVLSVFNYCVILFGVFWGFSLLGVDMSTLLASAGILALVIGFGAESLIADMVTGLFMIVENEYNVGDIIELSGYRGTVTEIGIRTTQVTDAGGNVKIFNNSDMRNVVNMSNQNSYAVCDFPIAYEQPLAEAEKALEEVLDKVYAENGDKLLERPKYSGVQQLADSAVVLRVVANVREADRFSVARILNRALLLGMEERGITCPYNQLVVRSEH